MAFRDTLITAKQAHDLYVSKGGQFIETTWYLPNSSVSGLDKYEIEHLPNARFFDIDAASDHTSHLPHTMPDKAAFWDYCHSLGLSLDKPIIIYDNLGVMCAFRVFYMFHEFGFDHVYILDGGLKAWTTAGFETDDQIPKREHTKTDNAPSATQKGQFCLLNTVIDNLDQQTYQVIDARAGERFRAEVLEPRAGLRSGHIPGAINVPYLSLFQQNQCLKSNEEIVDIFQKAGFNPKKPSITSCGSGVTACILAYALGCIGHEDVLIYDGSWSEWGQLNHLPIEPAPELIIA